ncbi:hypothetical protein NQZ68_002543 [Dissostichus eleginoides]|nr:hypothetical protein NQZ68_002543 [Dissostichus eleginoides]
MNTDGVISVLPLGSTRWILGEIAREKIKNNSCQISQRSEQEKKRRKKGEAGRGGRGGGGRASHRSRTSLRSAACQHFGFPIKNDSRQRADKLADEFFYTSTTSLTMGVIKKIPD